MTVRCLQIALVVASFAALVAATAAPLRADDPPRRAQSESAKLAIEIRQLVDELQAIRSAQAAADKRHEDELARVGRQIETLGGQLAPAEAAVADQQTQIERLQQSLADDRRSTASNRAWIDRIAAAAMPVARGAASRVIVTGSGDAVSPSAAFAGIVDRLAAANSATGQNDPGDRAAAVGELCRAFSDQWLPARSVSLSNEQVRLDGDRRAYHAWVYRVGLASQAFVGEGSDVIGVSSGDAASPWSVDMPAEAAAQIRQLIDVAREQKPPAILPIPVRISPAAARDE